MDIGTGRDVLAAGGREAWRKGGEAGMQCEEPRLSVHGARESDADSCCWVGEMQTGACYLCG